MRRSMWRCRGFSTEYVRTYASQHIDMGQDGDESDVSDMSDIE